MSKPSSSAAIRTALRGHEPSPEQWEAIEHPPVPVAIIAGAGAGKTAIMAARIVWMVEQEMYRPSQILGLTFTNKAALELEERIIQAFGAMDPPPPETPSVATYNSFADRLVREHGVRIGIEPDVGLLSQAQSWQLLMHAFAELPPFEAIESRSMASVMRTALALADACANHRVLPERIIEEDRRVVEEAQAFDDDIVKASRQRIELAGVVRAYIDAKRKAGRIDFGDQVTHAVEVLETFPEVTRDLQERYPALLLDEYQDTNIAQRKLLQLLAPTGHNVTAVGDARQNIFQWRGSTLFNLIDFPRTFLRDGDIEHEYLSLSENYRSGGRILAVANRLIDAVPAERRPGKPLRPHEENGLGSVATKVISDQYAEAGFIGDEIQQLHGQSTAPGRDPVEWSDVAILVRRRAHIAPIYHALKERDIPVEVVGLSGLLQVPEVVDTVAWLRVLADAGPSSNRWLARILLGPRFRIHYRDLALLARWAAEHNKKLADAKREQEETTRGSDIIVPKETELEPEELAFSLTEALDHLGEIEGLPPLALERLLQARVEIEQLRAKTSGALLELVQSVIAEAGIAEALEASVREDAASARANLTSFLGSVASFAPISGEPSLQAFLAYLDAAEDVEETLDLSTPAAGDSVKLMTVHQAKGLEFEIVFVPCVAARVNDKGELVDSIFPDTRTSNPMTSYGQLPHSVREDAMHLPSPWKLDKDGGRVPKKKNEYRVELVDRAIEDERRLFYVALTRAKQRLYVTAAWWYERQASQRGPSLFFKEVADAPETECLPDDPEPEENPLREMLARRAVWPPARPATLEPDSLFPLGYPAVVAGLVDGSATEDEVLALLGPEDRDAAQERLEEHLQTIAALERVSIAAAPEPSVRALSATRAVHLALSGLAGVITRRPLPERPSIERRIGTEIHRWIEEQARGLSGLADEEALDLPAAHVERAQIQRLREAWVAMGYPERTLARLDTGEPMAEVPFVMRVGETLVRGRIDAVYETERGELEIVDFKTGLEPEESEKQQLDQLMLYAAALGRLMPEYAGPLTLTYAYLASGRQVSRTIERAEAESAHEQLMERLASLPA